MWVKIVIGILLTVLSFIPFGIKRDNPADNNVIQETWTFVGICAVLAAIVWGSVIISIAKIRSKRQ